MKKNRSIISRGGGGLLRPEIARYVRRRLEKAAGADGTKIRKRAPTTSDDVGGNKQNQAKDYPLWVLKKLTDVALPKHGYADG